MVPVYWHTPDYVEERQISADIPRNVIDMFNAVWAQFTGSQTTVTLRHVEETVQTMLYLSPTSDQAKILNQMNTICSQCKSAPKQAYSQLAPLVPNLRKALSTCT